MIGRPALSLAALGALTLSACSSSPLITQRSTAPTPTVVAVEMVKGLPVTTAQVRDGSGNLRPVRLVLDTGAHLPLFIEQPVFKWAARAAQSTDGYRRFANVRGDVLTARTIRVAEVQFGALTLKDVATTEAVWHPDYAPPVRLGILGWPAFEGQRLLIDLAQARLIVGRSAPDAPCGVALRVEDGSLFVMLKVGNRTVRAVLDTAATRTFVTDPALMKAAFVLPGVGVIELGARHAMPRATGVGAMFADAPEVILGAPFFTAQRVTIDFARRCLDVVPAE